MFILLNKIYLAATLGFCALTNGFYPTTRVGVQVQVPVAHVARTTDVYKKTRSVFHQERLKDAYFFEDSMKYLVDSHDRLSVGDQSAPLGPALHYVYSQAKKNTNARLYDRLGGAVSHDELTASLHQANLTSNMLDHSQDPVKKLWENLGGQEGSLFVIQQPKYSVFAEMLLSERENSAFTLKISKSPFSKAEVTLNFSHFFDVYRGETQASTKNTTKKTLHEVDTLQHANLVASCGTSGARVQGIGTRERSLEYRKEWVWARNNLKSQTALQNIKKKIWLHKKNKLEESFTRLQEAEKQFESSQANLNAVEYNVLKLQTNSNKSEQKSTEAKTNQGERGLLSDLRVLNQESTPRPNYVNEEIYSKARLSAFCWGIGVGLVFKTFHELVQTKENKSF